MLRHLKLKNYRSFTDISFDLTGKNGIPRHLIILYGENGAGKTNIVNVLETLSDTFHTLNVRNIIMSYLGQQKETLDSGKLSALNAFLDISHIIAENKTIESDGLMMIEIGFCCEGKNGIYSLEFDNDGITRERLEYVLNKNKIVFYDIQGNEVRINSRLFEDAYLEELRGMITKYWGKHSLMAILFNAMDEYTMEYVEKSYSNSIIEVIKYLKTFTTFLVAKNGRRGFITNPQNMLLQLDEGEVNEKDEPIIKKTELLISKYFSSIYSDINSVYYKTNRENGTIKYSLFFERELSGKRISIKYDNESCGTRNLLALLPYFLSSMNECVVAIDEIDNGIHDILLENLIKNLHTSITGQLIVTTHNTNFINDYEYKDSVYFIVIDKENGEKTIKPLTEFGYRIQPNSNVMANYLKGTFLKRPWNGMDIDFKGLNNLNNENVETSG